MGKIEIKGAIIPDGDQWIYDWFGVPATSAAKVNSVLSAAQDNEEMELIINSPGGSVTAGSEIYTALKSHSGKVTGKVVGIAASAASVIAMSADELLMSPTAQMMIHRASSYGDGNKNDFEHFADVLSGIDESIANAYQIKTGLKTADLLDMMSKETWLNAQKAKELGFADGIMFEDEFAPTNSLAGANGMLPQVVIDKMRVELKQMQKEPEKTPPAETDNSLSLAKAKLNLTINI